MHLTNDHIDCMLIISGMLSYILSSTSFIIIPVVAYLTDNAIIPSIILIIFVVLMIAAMCISMLCYKNPFVAFIILGIPILILELGFMQIYIYIHNKVISKQNTNCTEINDDICPSYEITVLNITDSTCPKYEELYPKGVFKLVIGRYKTFINMFV